MWIIEGISLLPLGHRPSWYFVAVGAVVAWVLFIAVLGVVRFLRGDY